MGTGVGRGGQHGGSGQGRRIWYTLSNISNRVVTATIFYSSCLILINLLLDFFCKDYKSREFNLINIYIRYYLKNVVRLIAPCNLILKGDMNATRLHSTVKSLLEHQITEPVLIFYVFRLTIHISKYTFICISAQGRQTGGGWGVTTPLNFGWGG